nr:MAG TPA: hypothetical protein [Caudoviricetes sp.]
MLLLKEVINPHHRIDYFFLYSSLNLISFIL